MRLATTSLSTSSESGTSCVKGSTSFGSRRIGCDTRSERTRENGVQEHVRPRLEMLRTRILDLVVTDAVLARYEYHFSWGDTRNVDRIIARAAHHFTVRKP